MPQAVSDARESNQSHTTYDELMIDDLTQRKVYMHQIGPSGYRHIENGRNDTLDILVRKNTLELLPCNKMTRLLAYSISILV